MAKKLVNGGKFNSKFKKKKSTTYKKGAKSAIVGGLGSNLNLVGTDSSQLEILKYFCPEAMGTSLGVPTTIDARE